MYFVLRLMKSFLGQIMGVVLLQTQKDYALIRKMFFRGLYKCFGWACWASVEAFGNDPPSHANTQMMVNHLMIHILYAL